MDNIQAIERQIDRAIYALDYLKVDVNLHDVLYMLQYSHDERNLALDSWGGYVAVSECLQKRIAAYEEQKKECNEACEACMPDPNTQPRMISVTTGDGKKFEGIVHYVGEV